MLENLTYGKLDGSVKCKLCEKEAMGNGLLCAVCDLERLTAASRGQNNGRNRPDSQQCGDVLPEEVDSKKSQRKSMTTASEKRSLTFRQLRRNCMHLDCAACADERNRTTRPFTYGKCRAKYCPIWKRMAK